MKAAAFAAPLPAGVWARLPFTPTALLVNRSHEAQSLSNPRPANRTTLSVSFRVRWDAYRSVISRTLGMPSHSVT